MFIYKIFKYKKSVFNLKRKYIIIVYMPVKKSQTKPKQNPLLKK